MEKKFWQKLEYTHPVLWYDDAVESDNELITKLLVIDANM